MRIWIPKIFRRDAEPAPAASPAAAPVTPRGVQESVIDSVPVTYMESRIPEVDSAFGYGHLDGRRGVDAEHFRGFIEHTVEGEGIDQRIAELKAEEDGLRQRAATLRQQRADMAAGAEALRHLREKEGRSAAEVDSARIELERAEETARQHERGSYTHAAMFLVAGLVFILGDVVMTRKIVADALQLTGHKFFGLLDESWVFALGLAMISIVLKPAYDRLVEKPYWQGKEKPFLAVILMLAACSLVTLYVLGDFRSDAYASQQRLGMLEAKEGISETERLQGVDRIQEQMLDNPLAAVSFVLSGILFATAGAVTLSIGMRYGRTAFHERRPARQRVKQTGKALQAARDASAANRQEIATRTEQMERLRTLTGDESPPLVLEERADAIAEQRRALQQAFVSTRQRRLRSLYDDGYELGSVVARTAEAAAQTERPRRKRPRPFVALRRVIREMALTPETLN